MIKIDVHQHVWTEPLVRALASRHELPFVRVEGGLDEEGLLARRPMSPAEELRPLEGTGAGDDGRSRCACPDRIPSSRRTRAAERRSANQSVD